MDNLFKLSVSKAKTFESCKTKYNFQYNLKSPQKSFAFLSLGKTLHKVLEDFHQYYLDGGTEPYNKVIGRCFKSACTEYKAELSHEMKKECYDMVNDYLKLISLNQTGYNQIKNVLSCEKPFALELDNNLNHTILLNGAIDRVQKDDDGILHVCDYKSTKNKKYLENDFFQLQTYAYVLHRMMPEVTKVRTSYILFRHQFEFITKDFELDEIMEVPVKMVKYVDSILKETEFPPTKSFLCEYCSYYDICPHVEKKILFGSTDW